nr:hypothetical protein [uncultured Nocardioides sp.]
MSDGLATVQEAGVDDWEGAQAEPDHARTRAVGSHHEVGQLVACRPQICMPRREDEDVDVLYGFGPRDVRDQHLLRSPDATAVLAEDRGFPPCCQPLPLDFSEHEQRCREMKQGDAIEGQDRNPHLSLFHRK